MLRRLLPLVLLVLSIGTFTLAAGLETLPSAGALLGDSSGDGLADVIRARVILPARPAPPQKAVAAVILGRAAFESTGMDFDLVSTDTEWQASADVFPVVVGQHNQLLPSGEWRAMSATMKGVTSWAGLVLGKLNGRPALFLAGTDPGAELYAARAFFDRWPYAWEIWGRTDGITYERILSEVGAFFQGGETRPANAEILAVYYVNDGRFDRDAVEAENLAREQEGYLWDTGEVSRMVIRVDLDPERVPEAIRAIQSLADGRVTGARTDVLNYPGVAAIEFRFASDTDRRALLPRYSLPTRFLNRRYVAPSRIAEEPDVWLENLYQPGGFYRDTNTDQLADDTRFQIVPGPAGWVPSLPVLAARMALETTGCRFPLVRLDTELPELDRCGSLLLLGTGSRQAAQLSQLGLVEAPSGEFAGAIQAINSSRSGSHVLVNGVDDAGIDTAVAYLARYYPYLDRDRAEDRTVESLLTTVEDIVNLRDPGASTAAMMAEKSHLLKLLSLAPGMKARCDLRLDSGGVPLPRIAKALGEVMPENCERDVQERRSGKVEFRIQRELPWEVDDVLRDVHQALAAHPDLKDLRLDIRVSEPADVRRNLARTLQLDLERVRPGQVSEIRVGSAYKQGFSWLCEDISPRLKGHDTARIRITFQVLDSGFDAHLKVYSEPVRWLQELYPVDDILARDLGLRPVDIEFVQRPAAADQPIYTVTAWDHAGKEILSEAFSPFFETRPFFRRYPSWGQSPVPQAGFRLTTGEHLVAESRTDTDMGRVWAVYQDVVLPRLEEYILKKTGRKPTRDKQPFFQRLVMDLQASEPDESIGLGEEHVSALESAHEDFYFLTLEYLNQLLIKDQPQAGESVHYVRANPFAAPGTVLPLVHPGRPGKGAVVEFRLEVPLSDAPDMTLSYTTLEGGERKETVKTKAARPAAVHCEGLYLAGPERVAGVRIRLEWKDDADYQSFCRFFQAYQRLVRDGMPTPLAALGLRRLELHLISPGAEGILRLDLTRVPVPPPAPSAMMTDTSTTDRIIRPSECNRLMLQYRNVPGFRVFKAGRSYEGRDIYAAEVLAPSTAEVVSRAKMILHKPTIMLTGRQHANEVSSTGYLLELMRRLARDPEWMAYRRTINFVIHPLENPDGAATAMSLQELTPTHALHAGRFTSLGIDVGYEVERPDTILTEARVRNRLYRRWLPDIYLNLHGYPSHEWVQQFSGYTPYLFRQYWIPRGWFAYFRSDDSGLEPEYREAGQDLMDYISTAMNGVREIGDFNRDQYDRYRRWAIRWQPHIHYLDMVDGVSLYHSRRSGKAVRPGPRTRTTFAEGVPEVMDETAHDGFLAFLSRQGLTYIRAHLDYLASSRPELVPVEEETPERTFFQTFRRRPVRIGH